MPVFMYKKFKLLHFKAYRLILNHDMNMYTK